MMTKGIMEEYTKYIDTSEMIMEYYKNQTTAGLEKYFLTIENWLQKDVPPEENKPLVIQAQEGVGKKTLVAQWMKYHQQKSQKNCPDLIIPHFAGTGGNNANHSYAIYKILIRLRENFNISQKVELLESKLVHYFKYWLEVSSKALIGKIVDDSTIILIFDGINMFIDPDTGEEANVSLWLPAIFPHRIKVIVTTEPDSQAVQHFEAAGCEIITIEEEPQVYTTLINNHLARPSYITDENYKQKVIEILKKKPAEVTKNSLFVKTYLSTLLPYPSENIIKENDINKADFAKLFKDINLTELEGINHIDQLNSFLIDHFSKNIMPSEKFEILMAAFTLTEKGLTEKELIDLVGVNPKEWKNLIAIFKTFLMLYKGLWKINNEPFKKAVSHKFLKNNPEKVRQIHEDIAQVLKNTPNSIRKIEEQTYHLYRCRSYFQLKEAISSIENFLLLFNPNNKFELCRYWQILEQKGFDPSSEYTKAIEGFEIHYRPNPEDTFMIILQVSRFLKEFSDFETQFTPEFRHPPIRGGVEIKEIGLRREIKKMGMYVAENWEDDDDKADELEELEHELAKEFPDYSDVMLKDMVMQIYASTKKKREGDATQKSTMMLLESHPEGQESALLEATDRGNKGLQKKKRREIQILDKIEALNVDIPENREKFRAYYTQKKSKDQHNQTQVKKKERYLDEDDQVPKQDQVETKKRLPASRGVTINSIDAVMTSDAVVVENKVAINQPIERSEFELMENDREFQPTFYYYKRWIWMMFPWVCISFKLNYAKIIFECFSSATKYISVPDEREKTRQALKIAIEAKLKKQMVLAKPQSMESSLKKSMKLDLSSSPNKSQKLPPLSSRLSNPFVQKDLTLDATLAKSLVSESTPQSARGKLELQSLTTKNEKRPHHFFITNEFLDPNHLNNMTSSLSHRQTTTLQDSSISMISKDRLNQASIIKEKSLLSSEKRFENTLQKSNESIKALLLPKYQDSVLDYSSKNIEELDGKVQDLHLRLNDIIYKNKLAAKKLKDLLVLDGNLKQTGATDLVEKAQQRTGELERQLEKAENLKNEEMKQKDRLEKIINVCLKNKKEDELYIRSLNYLLTNFNKMIQWERQATYNDLLKATELEKLSHQYLKAHSEKMETYAAMMDHIRSEKQKSREVNNQITQVYSTMETSANDTVINLKKEAQIRKEKQEEKVMKMNALKNQMAGNREDLEEMRGYMQKIEEKIGLDFDSPKFLEFSAYVEKIIEFETSAYELNEKIAKLKEQKAILSSHLDTLRKASSNQKPQIQGSKTSLDGIEDKDELEKILKTKKKRAEDLSRNIMKSTKLVLDTKMALGKLCAEVGAEFDKNLMSSHFPTEKVVDILQQKLKAIEEKLGPEDFAKFKKGELIKKQAHKPSDDFNLVKNDTIQRTPVKVFKQGRIFIEVATREYRE